MAAASKAGIICKINNYGYKLQNQKALGGPLQVGLSLRLPVPSAPTKIKSCTSTNALCNCDAMDQYSSSFSSLLSLIITLFCLTLHQPSPASAAARFSKIYAFGDSYTDTGNTQSSTGPTSYNHVSNPPYGMTFFHRPTNRYSDGRLVVDFLATNLSLPFLAPYRNRNAHFSRGANFAVAGSTAIRHEFYVENNITINTTPQSLATELGWFNEMLATVGKRKGSCSRRQQYCGRRMVLQELEDSLIWVGEMGANDYAYSSFSSVPLSSIQQLAVKSLTGFLQVPC